MAITHNDLVKTMTASRLIVSDETALKTMDMFPYWKDHIGLTVTNEDLSKGFDRYQHNGKLWKLVQPTVFQSQFEPGKPGMESIFLEVTLEEWPEWRQPTGAHDSYNAGDKVTHKGERYISEIDGNTTEPGTDERFWKRVS